MCTPSRTPPPWVFDRYPGVLNIDAGGQRLNYGSRYTIGLSHSEFIRLAQGIDRAVIEHFAGNEKSAVHLETPFFSNMTGNTAGK